MGHREHNPKKEIHSVIGPSLETQINNLTSHLKELEKEHQTKPEVSNRKEIIKIIAEINEIESKKK